MIREAKIEDVNQISEIVFNSWQDTYNGIISDNYLKKLSISHMIKKWTKMITEIEHSKTFVYEENNKIQGVIRIGNSEELENTGEIYVLYIDINKKRTGIGSKLFNYGIKELTKMGHNNIILWCAKENKGSIEFYKKMGGNITKERTIELDGNKILEVAIEYDLSKKQKYILNSPESLSYITNKMDDILPAKIDYYKKLFKIDNLDPIIINYFDDKDKFRNFIYDIRGTKDTLPLYAVGTYDKGMINAYIDPKIIINSPKYNKKLYLPCHELFHILYMRYVLKDDISKRIVWYDEGMAQFLSGEKNELLDEDKFKKFYLEVKDNTLVIPNLNEISHGTNFYNDNYNGYDLSYLCIRYLSEILNNKDFQKLMSDFDRIKQYGNNILNDMFTYYDKKLKTMSL